MIEFNPVSININRKLINGMSKLSNAKMKPEDITEETENVKSSTAVNPSEMLTYMNLQSVMFRPEITNSIQLDKNALVKTDEYERIAKSMKDFEEDFQDKILKIEQEFSWLSDNAKTDIALNMQNIFK